jgi:hypothetical protein
MVVPVTPEPPPQVRAVSPDDRVPQTLEDIQREAAAKAVEEKKQAAEFKNMIPRLRKQELDEAWRKANEDRPPFHDELRTILVRAKGNKAGELIDQLCDRYGRSTSPEVKAYVNTRLRREFATLGLANQIEMMRASGVPEPMILDHLAKKYKVDMMKRGGPRSLDEVLVRAARQLLAMPPPSRRGTAAAVPLPPRPALPNSGGLPAAIPTARVRPQPD